MAKIHELKTDPQQWDAVAEGRKTFEIRFNDRNFEVGDQVLLKRTDHTGEEMRAGKPLIYSRRPPLHLIVTHILTGPVFGLQVGWVILSFR